MQLTPQPMAVPDIVDVNGVEITRTHTAMALHFTPYKKTRMVTVNTLYGIMVGGEFTPIGQYSFREMDADGLAALMNDTAGGKPAGTFRITDVLPAMDKRDREKAAPKG